MYVAYIYMHATFKSSSLKYLIKTLRCVGFKVILSKQLQGRYINLHNELMFHVMKFKWINYVQPKTVRYGIRLARALVLQHGQYGFELLPLRLLLNKELGQVLHSYNCSTPSTDNCNLLVAFSKYAKIKLNNNKLYQSLIHQTSVAQNNKKMKTKKQSIKVWSKTT